MISRYGGSLALAEQALKATGSSVDKEMEDTRRNMVVRLYMHKQLDPRIVVTRQMVKDEYDRSASKHEDAEIELFTITLPLTRWLREPGTDGKKGPIIANPSARANPPSRTTGPRHRQGDRRQGPRRADFAVLAEDYASADQRANYGGYWPKVKHDGSLNPKIETYAFSLPANTVGEPLLLTDDDFHRSAIVVMKVGTKKESRVIPFSEAQDAIRDGIRDRQYHQLYVEYMDKLTRALRLKPSIA